MEPEALCRPQGEGARPQIAASATPGRPAFSGSPAWRKTTCPNGNREGQAGDAVRAFRREGPGTPPIHASDMPPSTTKVDPVTKEASSDTKNRAARAISSGCANLPIGCNLSMKSFMAAMLSGFPAQS